MDAGLKVGVEGEAEFKRQIREIDESLKTMGAELKSVASEYDKNDKSSKNLTAQNEVLNREIDAQKNKLGLLKDKLASAKSEYGESDVKTQQYQQAVYNATTALNKMERQLDDNTKSIKEFSAQQIKAAKDSEEFKRAQEKLQGAFNAVKIAVAAVGASIAGFAIAALDSADELQKLSDTTGLTAERLQELQYAGNNLGVELATITGAQAKLTKSMAAAQKGTGDAAKAFKALGISVVDGNGEMRDAKTVMNEAFSALNNVGNETERDALAMQIFGKSAMEMNPLIKAGGDELNRLAKEARESGAVMSNEAVAGLDSFGDAVGNMKTALTGKFGEAFAELAPTLTEFTDKIKNIDITPLVNALQWVIDNAGTIAAGAVAIGTGMLMWNVVSTVQAVVGAMKAWKAATEGMTIAQQIINAVMAANPIGLIITAIAALVAGIIVLWNTNDKFKEFILNMGAKIQGFFLGLVDWFKVLPQKMADIGKNIVSGIWNGIAGMATWLKDKVGGFFGGIVDGIKKALGIHSPSTVFAGIGENMAAGLGKGFGAEMDGVAKQINNAIPAPNIKTSIASGNEIRLGGTIRVEGVNNKNELIGVSDYAVEEALARVLKRQVRMA